MPVAMFALDIDWFGSLRARRKAGKMSCTQCAIRVAGSAWPRRCARWEAKGVVLVVENFGERYMCMRLSVK